MTTPATARRWSLPRIERCADAGYGSYQVFYGPNGYKTFRTEEAARHELVVYLRKRLSVITRELDYIVRTLKQLGS